MVYGIQRRPDNLYPSCQLIDQKRGNWNNGHPRIFKESIDRDEYSALIYILENLAKKSLIKLMPMQGKLKKKGNQLDHLHPLAFFMAIMLHPKLRDYFYQLKNKNNKAWKEFLNGAVNSFKDEKRGHNIHDQHIEAFCHRLNKDPHFVRHLMHTENWIDFIKHL